MNFELQVEGHGFGHGENRSSGTRFSAGKPWLEPSEATLDFAGLKFSASNC